MQDLKKAIAKKNYEVDANDCVEYLRNHNEDAEYFGRVLLNLKRYVFNDKKNIIKAIITQLPSLLSDFLRPFLSTADGSFIESSYFIRQIVLFIKETFEEASNTSYEQIAEICASQFKEPYSIMSLYFIYKIDKLRAHYEKINPDIYKKLDKINRAASPYFKTYYAPKTERCDSKDPHVSKFGGSFPYLSTEEEEELNKSRTIFSLYVPSLPEEIQMLFPKGHEYLLVGYETDIFNVKLYTDSEINSLKYGPIPSNAFNQPRTIIGWEERKMLPYKYEYPWLGLSTDEFFFFDVMKNDLNEDAKTYLGGYPYFIQHDATPSSEHKLLLEMSKSEASTNNWMDSGVGQVWIKTEGDKIDFKFIIDCF